MNKMLLIHKDESKFIEIIIAEGKPTTKRDYANWERVAARLSQLGVQSEDIAQVRFEFESGKESLSFQIP